MNVDPDIQPLLLSIVIPALNEEEGIGQTLEEVLGAESELRKLGVKLGQIIVVDDGSSDRTQLIASSRKEVTVISHEETRGYGAALKTGFSAAKGQLLAFLDADGTYPPEEFPSLCRTLLEKDADIVVGSRRSGSLSRMPFLRRLGNTLWSGLVSIFSGCRVLDPASGMRILQRTAFDRLQPLPDGLNFTPIMTTRAIHEGLSLIEIPIPYEERSGSSKLSVVKDGTRFLKTIIWALLEYNPAGILGLGGGVALLISIILGLLLIALRIQGTTELEHLGVLSVYSSLVFGVAGVSICALAFVFDNLVRLFHRDSIPRSRLSQYFSPLAQGRRFGCLGLLLFLMGCGIALVAISLGLKGWPIERLWLWLVGSALFLLVGIQLLISWLILRVLQALRERLRMPIVERDT